MKKNNKKFKKLFSLKKIKIYLYIVIFLIFSYFFVYIGIIIKNNVYDLMENEQLLIDKRKNENKLSDTDGATLQNFFSEIKNISEILNSKNNIRKPINLRNVFD